MSTIAGSPDHHELRDVEGVKGKRHVDVHRRPRRGGDGGNHGVIGRGMGGMRGFGRLRMSGVVALVMMVVPFEGEVDGSGQDSRQEDGGERRSPCFSCTHND